MPCDTVQTTSVDLGKMAAPLAVAAVRALETAGEIRNVTISADASRISFRDRAGYLHTMAAGRLTSTAAGEELTGAAAAAVRRAYSAQVIEYAARRQGWTLQKTGARQYAARRA